MQKYKDDIKVLVLPPQRWQPARDNFKAGLAPAEGELERLMAQRHGVHMELMDPYDVPINPFGRKHPVYRGIDPVRAVSVLARYRSIDLVLSVFESPALLPLLFRSYVAFKPKIAIWDIAPDNAWRTRRIIQDFIIPRVDHVFLLSPAQEFYIEDRWRAGSKTSVIWQSVDTNFYSSMGSSNLGPILAIGDDHGRDWPTLLAAVSDLDIDLIIKTSQPLNLRGLRRCRVQQISHRISYQDLRTLYAQCRFVVLPLRATLNVSGVSSILEAMSMGKALVISDNPAIRGYIQPDLTCKLVPVGDVVAMKEAILNLLANQNTIENMGHAARVRASNLYSISAMADRFSVQIQKLVRHDYVNE